MESIDGPLKKDAPRAVTRNQPNPITQEAFKSLSIKSGPAPILSKITVVGQYSYEGETLEGIPHGTGSANLYSGDTYQGAFSNSKFHGKGKYTFKDQGVYEGDFVNGHFDGYGKLTFPKNAGSYEGEFYNSQYNGQGTLIENETTYKGSFFQGIKHGKGVLTDEDGLSFTVRYFAGKLLEKKPLENA
jgi:hypothetical protein